MAPGSTVTFLVEDAPAFAAGVLVAGVSRVDLPVAGGLLVPSTECLIPVLTDGAGSSALPVLVAPAPSGTTLWLQAWIADPGAPTGFTATHGLRAEVE